MTEVLFVPVIARYENSWTERSIGNIMECIDQGFADVLSAEFDWITKNLTQSQIDSLLEESEASIDLLRTSGASPNYHDPMVCLRYVIMYQLPHINLAYSLIKGSQYEENLVSTLNLHVVDFGTGCMAMTFGVVLAVADALDSGERIDEVRIDSIDESAPMMKLGRDLLQCCYRHARNTDGMKPFVQAYKLLKFRHYTDWQHIRSVKGAECWVTALHTLYDESERDVGIALSGINNTVKPIQTFITCHESKADIAKRIWPDNGVWSRGDESNLRFEGQVYSSSAAEVAFEKCFHPQTWHQPNLYTAFRDLATFTTRELITDSDELDDLPWL